MSDDGVKLRCIVRAYEDNDDFAVQTREALLTVNVGTDTPEWIAVPPVEQSGTTGYDLNPYVSSDLPLFNWSATQGTFPQDDGVLVLGSVADGDYPITATVENTDGSSSSNEFTWTVPEAGDGRRFDDVDNLVAYFSTIEGPPAVSDGNVTTWDSVYGSQAVTLYNPDLGDNGTELPFGEYNTGEMPGIGTYTSGASVGGRLQAEGLPALGPESTVIWTERRFYNNQGNNSMTLRRDSDGVARRTINRGGDQYSYALPSNAGDTEILVLADTPRVMAAAIRGTASPTGVHVRVDDESFSGESLDSAESITQISFMNSPNSGSSFMRGSISLVAIYDRILTTEEIDYVMDLARYWLDNGEAQPE